MSEEIYPHHNVTRRHRIDIEEQKPASEEKQINHVEEGKEPATNSKKNGHTVNRRQNKKLNKSMKESTPIGRK